MESAADLEVQEMCHPLNRDRFDRRISQDDFFVASRRRISFVSGIDVRPELFPQSCQLRKEVGENVVRSFSSESFLLFATRLLQISGFIRACKALMRLLVTSGSSPACTRGSPWNPGKRMLKRSTHAASIVGREGNVAASSS